jgi:hypothetical protein
MGAYVSIDTKSFLYYSNKSSSCTFTEREWRTFLIFIKNLYILRTTATANRKYYHISYWKYVCVCIVACAVTYSQSFTYYTYSSSPCTAWTAFLANLTCTTYTKLQIYGSQEPTGITITDSSVVTALATALRNSTAYTGTSNGYTMKVGSCGGGYEITSTGSVCNCNKGYTVRPCSGTTMWGGINGSSCNAAAQTMSLSFSWNSYLKMEYLFHHSFSCRQFLRNFLLKNRKYKRAYFHTSI